MSENNKELRSYVIASVFFALLSANTFVSAIMIELSNAFTTLEEIIISIPLTTPIFLFFGLQADMIEKVLIGLGDGNE